jgi:hypothetical protein
MDANNQADNLDVVYRIDAQDRIVKVNIGWTRFAEINGASHLDRDQLIGQPIWEFIVDKDTSRIYEVLLREVRENCQTLTFPFRCDSPEMRRYMEMGLVACGQGCVEFRSRMVRTERRERRLYCQYTAVPAQGLLLRCSFCNRVRYQGEWVDVATAADTILDRDMPLQVCYAICSACSSTISDRCFCSSKKERANSSS